MTETNPVTAQDHANQRKKYKVADGEPLPAISLLADFGIGFTTDTKPRTAATSNGLGLHNCHCEDSSPAPHPTFS